MNIAKRLREIRQAKHISIYKISKETGISQNHISAVELGKRQPTIETLRRITIPLGITLAELFQESEEVSILTDAERELVENYRMLPEEKASVLLTLSILLK